MSQTIQEISAPEQFGAPLVISANRNRETRVALDLRISIRAGKREDESAVRPEEYIDFVPLAPAQVDGPRFRGTMKSR